MSRAVCEGPVPDRRVHKDWFVSDLFMTDLFMTDWVTNLGPVSLSARKFTSSNPS